MIAELAAALVAALGDVVLKIRKAPCPSNICGDLHTLPSAGVIAFRDVNQGRVNRLVAYAANGNTGTEVWVFPGGGLTDSSGAFEGMRIPKGERAGPLVIDRPSQIYATGTGGDKVGWIAWWEE